ncbi:MAG TPA: hypothetical protein VNZ85_16295 [Caulobacter sp.]|nr:hypothetical protein [Caulobacter sp.]
MSELLFEIWSDREGGSSSMYRAHPQNDKVRRLAEPNAILVHSFMAESGFDAFRQNNAWHDYGPWTPPDGLEDQPFTEDEAAEQRAYLLERNLG